MAATTPVTPNGMNGLNEVSTVPEGLASSAISPETMRITNATTFPSEMALPADAPRSERRPTQAMVPMTASQI